MQKIMFNNTYGLTDSVREESKNLTRREFQFYDGSVETTLLDGYLYIYKDTEKKELLHKSRYHIGEVVAIAESYESLNKRGYVAPEWMDHMCEDSKGYKNKMFVKPELMPDGIQITDIWGERLQDISDEDCLAEGVLKYRCIIGFAGEYVIKVNNKPLLFHTPRQAFAALIDKMNRKGTWERNPFAVVYCFQYVKFD